MNAKGMEPKEMRAWRKGQKWTQSQMATMLEVSLRTILRWEKGDTIIPRTVGLHLAQWTEHKGLKEARVTRFVESGAW